MTIWLTGATGFIGRRLARKIAKAFPEAEIHALVRASVDNELERSGREVLAQLPLHLHEVDLLLGTGLSSLPPAPRLLFHLASCTEMLESDHSINDVGTRNLLEAIGPVPGMHLIYASSIASLDLRDDYSRPVDESTPFPARTCNEYGRSKLRTLAYLKKMSREQGFHLSTMRVTGVYGENTRPTGLYDMVGRLCRRRSLLTRINWPGKVSMIYVDDIAELFVRLAQRPDPESYLELIPSVENYSLYEMCQLTYAAMQVPQPLPLYLPKWFWRLCRQAALRKGILERALPHRLYTRFWQLFVLCNHEFWNESLLLSQFSQGLRFKTFHEFTQERYGP